MNDADIPISKQGVPYYRISTDFDPEPGSRVAAVLSGTSSATPSGQPCTWDPILKAICFETGSVTSHSTKRPPLGILGEPDFIGSIQGDSWAIDASRSSHQPDTHTVLVKTEYGEYGEYGEDGELIEYRDTVGVLERYEGKLCMGLHYKELKRLGRDNSRYAYVVPDSKSGKVMSETHEGSRSETVGGRENGKQWWSVKTLRSDRTAQLQEGSSAAAEGDTTG